MRVSHKSTYWFLLGHPPPPKGEYIVQKVENSVINFTKLAFNEMYSPLGVGGGRANKPNQHL